MHELVNVVSDHVDARYKHEDIVEFFTKMKLRNSASC